MVKNRSGSHDSGRLETAGKRSLAKSGNGAMIRRRWRLREFCERTTFSQDNFSKRRLRGKGKFVKKSTGNRTGRKGSGTSLGTWQASGGTRRHPSLRSRQGGNTFASLPSYVRASRARTRDPSLCSLPASGEGGQEGGRRRPGTDGSRRCARGDGLEKTQEAPAEKRQILAAARGQLFGARRNPNH